MPPSSTRGAPVTCAMFRSNGSPDCLHSTSKGSLDFTAKSQWCLDPGSQESGQSRIPIGWIPPNLEILFRSRESLESSESFESEVSTKIWENVKSFFSKMSEEKMKEAMASVYRQSKVSGVRDFPSSCGRGAALVSREECTRIQQAWIKDKIGKSQEVEEDPNEDLSMCSDQGDDDPKDT
ncbi:Uncharacterized protein TCM_008835 [Theobroma cacao]|uniref:Uncharacterized protein n=1 Tax=Theobroma cacao TaxID=3641 RepID=A0A061E4F8_THECC|nr:Uncharacterized protein TCM_008835 [Theobroma cacao]